MASEKLKQNFNNVKQKIVIQMQYNQLLLNAKMILGHVFQS